MDTMFTDTIPFLSFQQQRILREHEQDMVLWQGVQLKDLWPENYDRTSKNEVKKIYKEVVQYIENMRNTPIDYTSFNPSYDFSGKRPQIVTDFLSPEKIMGRCPCPDESDTLRCCNLKTLDAVQQCGFACSYCSIQSFYTQNKIKVVSDLDSYLENLEPDPSVWHIGTGQSSDSLLLGDDYGTITALNRFAEKHSDIVIELKTKSARTDWISDSLAKNIISTWSVNANTVSAKEEHLASPVSRRIEAASKCASAGHLVGFHIHPMVWFTDWKKEYSELVRKLCDSVSPDMTVMVGIGTLTFTKQNLRTLRESKRPTRVTQMSLLPVAGKYSYSENIKKEMFSYVFSQFPSDWKEKVFFYLCMENKDLWLPCLGREYNSNEKFEADMKKHYFSKIQTLSDRKICSNI